MSFLGRWLCVLLCGLLIGAPTAAYAAPRQSAQTPFKAIFAGPAPAGAELPVSRNGVKDCGLRQLKSRPGVSYLYDGHGSVRGLADAAGNVTDSYDYDAYGNVIGRTGASEQPYLYAGERFVAELGLYYNRARYMDPSAGRFLTLDNWSGLKTRPLSLNKYNYTEGDPTNNTDPTGLFLLPQVQQLLFRMKVANSALSTGLHAISLTKLTIAGLGTGATAATIVLWTAAESVQEAESKLDAAREQAIQAAPTEGERQRRRSIPVFYVYESRWPNIYNHTTIWLSTNWMHYRLFYLGYRDEARATAAKKAAHARGVTRPIGYSAQFDEYPYASTRQGGSFSSGRYVPSRENSQHGGSLGAFYRGRMRGSPGNFLVAPVSKN